MRIEKTMATYALTSENTNLDNALASNYGQMNTLSTALADERCSGDAYAAIAQVINDLRIPFLKAQYIALEQVRSANDANIAALESLPESSAGVADTEEFYELIEKIQGQINRLYNLQTELSRDPLTAPQARGIDQLINTNAAMIDDINAKIAAMSDYDSSSASIYTTAELMATGPLAQAATSVNSYINTGSYGDMSWISDLDTLYAFAVTKQEERICEEASKKAGTILVSEDGEHFYFKGKKYSLADASQDLLKNLVEELAKNGLKWDAGYIVYASEVKAQDILEAAGIKGTGSYHMDKGKIYFRGYGNNMTKVCKYGNKYSVKAAPIFVAEDVTKAGIKTASHLARLSRLWGPVGAVVSGGLAFYKEYNSNPFYTTEEKLIRSSVDAVSVGAGGWAVGTGVGALGGGIGSFVAVGSVIPPVAPPAAIVGAAIGSVAGPLIYEGIYYNVLYDGVIDGVKENFCDAILGSEK